MNLFGLFFGWILGTLIGEIVRFFAILQGVVPRERHAGTPRPDASNPNEDTSYASDTLEDSSGQIDAGPRA